MFFRLYPILTTIIFLGLIFFTLYYFGSNFVFGVLGAGVIIIYGLTWKSVGRFTSTILPAFLILGSLPALSLMSSETLRYVAIVSFAAALYFELLAKGRLSDNPADKIALALLNGINFIIFFVWANLIFASFLNFSDLVFPVWLMLLISAFIAFTVSKDTLENNLALKVRAGDLRKNDINIASLIVALVVSQITWGLIFYPFRYRASAVILLSAYYLVFTATHFFLTKEEKGRKLAKDVIIVALAIVIMLLTSRWRYY